MTIDSVCSADATVLESGMEIKRHMKKVISASQPRRGMTIFQNAQQTDDAACLETNHRALPSRPFLLRLDAGLLDEPFPLRELAAHITRKLSRAQGQDLEAERRKPRFEIG